MRILHTSDWHLGRILHEHSLLPDQEKFLEDLLAHLRESRYDALVIAGDIFDRSVPSEEAVELWNRFLEDFAAVCPDTSLLAIAGNHDSATRLALASRLIERAGIHIRGGADRLDDPVTLRDADGAVANVWMVPFLWSGSLIQDREDGRFALQTQEEALAEAVRRIRARIDPSELNLLVAHCFASGAQVSDSERNLVGMATQIDPALFQDFDYVALGHLHGPQALGPRMRYSGTPLPYSFSESAQAKAMAAVTLRKGHDPVVAAIPVKPLRPMKDLRGTLEELESDPRYAGLEDSYVRVTLTEPSGVGQPVVRLRLRFPFLLEFQEYLSPQTGPMDAPSERLEVDLLDEFKDFERRLRGEAGASEGLLAAFSELRGEMERAR